MDGILVKEIIVKNEKYEAVYCLLDIGEELQIDIINDPRYKSICIIQLGNPNIELLADIFNKLLDEE